MIRAAREAFLDRWANLHPWLRGLILLASAAAIGYIAVSGPYQKFKSWRMERNLLAARNAVADRSMREARDLSLSALRADHSCLEAYRILEQATASLRDPWHDEIARALLSHPESSDLDRLTAFCGIATEIPLGLLQQAWSNLPIHCRQDLRFVTVFSDRLISERHFKEATLVLLAVPKTARTPPLDRRLIQVLIGSGKQSGYDEAHRLIAGAFPATGQDLAGWLELLEKIPLENFQPALLEPVRQALKHPGPADVARSALMLARLDYASHVSLRAEILEETIGRWKDRAPESLARFLMDLGLYQTLLETFPLEQAAKHPGLFRPLLEAAGRCGKWYQADLLLDSSGDLMPGFEKRAHRAVIAVKTGDSAAYVLEWTAARGEAKTSRVPDAFLTLHRIARDAAMVQEAEQAMIEAIRCGHGPLPLYSDLKPLLSSLAQQGHDKILLEICAIYLPFESTNPVLLAQLAYLASLNELLEPKTVLAAMEHLAKGFPKEVPIQCVLATAWLCAGKPAMAAKTFDRLALDPAQLSPGYQAAFLTTQVLNRRIARDDPHITGFAWKSVLPSERRKFNALIRGLDP